MLVIENKPSKTTLICTPSGQEEFLMIENIMCCPNFIGDNRII
jgi:hypothetical protein